MSDSMWRNRELSDEAQKLEKAEQFAQAAELYKQSYDLYPSSFVTSHYLTCLRKAGKSLTAVEFGRKLSEQLLNNSYVHSALSWALYDVYLKKSERTDDNEGDDGESDIQNDHAFPQIQKVAAYILKKSSTSDYLLRSKTIFAVCREAKLRGNWQIMYNFALHLDPEHLPAEPEEWNGQKMKPAYHRWLYIMVRSLLELKRYDECLEFANRGIEKYPNDKLFYWWQARARLALGQVEEALSDFERIDIRFPKEWYIEHDIASCYMQLQKGEEALLWFCKAANHPGDIEGRYKMFEQMSVLLEGLERRQEAYDHLQLAHDLAKRKHWDRPAETLQGQLVQFRKRHAEYFLEESEIPVGSQSTTYSRCKALWQNIIRASRPRRRGSIVRINPENEFGFISADNDEFYFRFPGIFKKIQPVKGMEVEFEVEKSFDRKKQKDSFVAINIRLIRKPG